MQVQPNTGNANRKDRNSTRYTPSNSNPTGTPTGADYIISAEFYYIN